MVSHATALDPATSANKTVRAVKVRVARILSHVKPSSASPASHASSMLLADSCDVPITVTVIFCSHSVMVKSTSPIVPVHQTPPPSPTRLNVTTTSTSKTEQPTKPWVGCATGGGSTGTTGVGAGRDTSTVGVGT